MPKLLICCLALFAIGKAIPRSRFKSPPRIVPYIVGGTDVDVDVNLRHKYPYIALLQYDAFSGLGTWENQCSAVLILRSGRYADRAVTTGSCVSNINDGSLEDPLNFRILTGVYYTEGFDAEVVTGINTIRRHPDYAMITNNRASNDVAVLRLAIQLDTGNARIATVTLSTETDGDLIGWQAEVTGWGRIDNVGLTDPEVLQEIDTSVLASSTCQSRLNQIDLRNTITDEHVCVQSSGNNKSPCLGDLGSPLVVTNTTSGVTRVGGLYSWGPGTFDEPCPTNYPSVFVRISYFRDWIYAQ